MNNKWFTAFGIISTILGIFYLILLLSEAVPGMALSSSIEGVLGAISQIMIFMIFVGLIFLGKKYHNKFLMASPIILFVLAFIALLIERTINRLYLSSIFIFDLFSSSVYLIYFLSFIVVGIGLIRIRKKVKLSLIIGILIMVIGILHSIRMIIYFFVLLTLISYYDYGILAWFMRLLIYLVILVMAFFLASLFFKEVKTKVKKS